MDTMQVRDQRHNPWSWVDNTVIDQFGAQLGAGGLAVYLLLARYAGNSDQSAFPALATLAAHSGLSSGAVRRRLAQLAALGLITVRPQYDRTGRQISNRYTLLATQPAAAPAQPDADVQAKRPGYPERQGGASTTARVAVVAGAGSPPDEGAGSAAARGRGAAVAGAGCLPPQGEGISSDSRTKRTELDVENQTVQESTTLSLSAGAREPGDDLDDEPDDPAAAPAAPAAADGDAEYVDLAAMQRWLERQLTAARLPATAVDLSLQVELYLAALAAGRRSRSCDAEADFRIWLARAVSWTARRGRRGRAAA